jgi:hypothetical protein
MFDHAGFRQLATQLRDHADGYEALGLTSFAAADWANHGFLPSEVGPWINFNFTACDASGWANRFVGVAEARGRADRGATAHSRNCQVCTP